MNEAEDSEDCDSDDVVVQKIWLCPHLLMLLQTRVIFCLLWDI